jgi:hypothetical protein
MNGRAKKLVRVAGFERIGARFQTPPLYRMSMRFDSYCRSTFSRGDKTPIELFWTGVASLGAEILAVL